MIALAVERPVARLRDDAPARRPAREPERAPAPASQIEALQRSAGNAAVAGLLGRRSAAGPVLARTLDAKVGSFGLSQATVTPARLRELLQTIEDAWDRMSADPVQVSYADDAKVERWRKHFATELAAALAEIGKGAPPDPEKVGLSLPEVQAGATEVAKKLDGAVRALGAMAGLINKAWDEWKAARDQDEAQRMEQQALQDAFAGFGLREKQAQWQAEAEAAAPAAPAEDDDERIDGFPHNGKHAPKKKWLEKAKLQGPAFPDQILMSNTAGKGATAVYKTRDPVTVVGWENEARENGLLLSGGFTIVHGFTEEVGSDHGEMTRFVRIDGDHGHPIIETHQNLNTAFTTYIKKDVADAKAAGNAAQLRRIWEFLVSLNLVPSRYGLRSEPPAPAAAPPQ